MAADYGRTSSSKVTQLPGTVRHDGNEPPGSDQLEPRVKALEDKFEKVDGKLDAISRDLAYLKGKVDAMPTTLQLGGFIVAVFAIAGVAKYLSP